MEQMIETVFAATHSHSFEAFWMSHLQALSTKPLPIGNPIAFN
jgi:hypothetical protein